MPENELGNRLLQEAFKWSETPYSNSKRTRGKRGGVDCLNFVAGPAMDLGIIGHIPTQEYDRKFWLRNQRLLLEGVEEGLQSLNEGYHYHFHKIGGPMCGDPNKGLVLPSHGKGSIYLVKTLPNLEHPNHAVFLAREYMSHPQVWILHADSAKGLVEYDVMPNTWTITHVLEFFSDE